MVKKNMKIMNIISIILIVICLAILLPCVYYVKEQFKNNNSNTTHNTTISDIFDTKYTEDISNAYMDSQIIKNTIPKVILQTYTDKNKIPDKVYENIKKYAPEYQHVVYDDKQCIDFLRKEYGEKYVKIFNNFERGGHKADLFRYCYLYKYGGIYLDIKTELIRPVNQIFNKNYLYTVIAKDDKSIYQGILATPPKNPIFVDLIKHILKTCEQKQDKLYYHIFVRYFYKLLTVKIKKYPIAGLNKINEFNHVYLFKEHCDTSKNNSCYDGLDKYGYCCFVNDFNLPIIKTRYADFPWY
jgi:mannosyltransferase OCH1-like enzyme